MSTLAALRRQLAQDDPAFARVQRGEPLADVERWVRAVDAARAGGWYTDPTLIGVDGLALVASRTTTDADQEVCVAGGRVMSCTCPAGRARTPCAHAAAVGLQLWAQALGCDLSEVPARALALTLLRQYVGPPPCTRGRPWGGRLPPDGEPETRYRGPESAGEFC